jgi:hypothetical protein
VPIGGIPLVGIGPPSVDVGTGGDGIVGGEGCCVESVGVGAPDCASAGVAPIASSTTTPKNLDMLTAQ